MKTVFTSDQVMHVWASRQQEEGRNQNRSVYFHGDSIYSYGYHFEMARHITDEIVFITKRSYFTTTTAKHLSKVRSAVHHKTTYIVPSFDNHIENLTYLVGIARGHYDRASKSIKHGLWELEQGRTAMLTAHNYKAAFKVDLDTVQVGFKSLWQQLLDGSYVSRETRAKIKEKVEKARRSQAVRDEARRIERELCDAQRAIEEAEKLAAWMRGEDTGWYRFAETRLRIKGDTVQTSKGAEVPTIEARNLYRALKLERDIVGQRVGHFTVSHVDSEVVRIGCHTIPMFEVERIGSELLAAN